MFIVKFKCKEAKTDCGEVLTHEGMECWLLNDSDGWVPATSSSTLFSRVIPNNIKTFEKETAAIKFMASWRGHPWYHVPNGNFEVIKVKEKYKQVFDGYEIDCKNNITREPLDQDDCCY